MNYGDVSRETSPFLIPIIFYLFRNERERKAGIHSFDIDT